ncbi:MAG: hypothetical protein ACKPKO_54205, partial [Candidatus Fonsibacter sp.]
LLDGRRIAIDFGITGQAKRTQGDPIPDYAQRQFHKYRHTIQNDLMPEGIAFRAAIWSQEGRPGKDAVEVIEGLSHQADKYRPKARKTEVRERLQH